VPKLDKNDSVSQQLAELKALGQLSTAPGASIGSMTAKRWQAGTNLLVKYGQIKAAIPASDLYTTQFLPKS
jgi:hypothetical protein